MSVIYILLPVALILATLAVVAFVRAVRGGQFDDLETPRWRVLTGDEDAEPRRGEGGPATGGRSAARRGGFD